VFLRERITDFTFDVDCLEVNDSIPQVNSAGPSFPAPEKEQIGHLNSVERNTFAFFNSSSSQPLKTNAESEQVSSSAAQKNQHIINALNSSTVVSSS